MEEEVGTEGGGEAFARQGMDEGSAAEKVSPHQCFSPQLLAPGLSGSLEDAIAASGTNR